MPRFSEFLSAQPIRQLRRIVVFVVGGTVVLIGVIMIVTPGPACLVIPAGLAILAAEFAWARRLLLRAKEYIDSKRSNPKDESP